MKFWNIYTIIYMLHILLIALYLLMFAYTSVLLLSNIFYQSPENFDIDDLISSEEFTASLQTSMCLTDNINTSQFLVFLVSLKHILSIAEDYPNTLCLLNAYRNIFPKFKTGLYSDLTISQLNYNHFIDTYNRVLNFAAINLTIYFNSLCNFNNKYKLYLLQDLNRLISTENKKPLNLKKSIEAKNVNFEAGINFIYYSVKTVIFAFVELITNEFELKTNIKTTEKVLENNNEGLYYCLDTVKINSNIQYFEGIDNYNHYKIGDVNKGVILMFKGINKNDEICVKDKEYKIKTINKKMINETLSLFNDKERNIMFETTYKFTNENGYLTIRIINRIGIHFEDYYGVNNKYDGKVKSNNGWMVKLIDFNTETTLFKFYVECL